MNEDTLEKEIILTTSQAYQAMIHMLYKYYEETSGNHDLTDILSAGIYKSTSDNPIDMYFKYSWDDVVADVLAGKPPRRQEW